MNPLPAAPRLVILTGAGISAESGLRTFRAADGLWEGHRIEDVATPEAFLRDPQQVHRFYNARRAQLRDPAVRPNAAHLALARLEQVLGDDLLLVTQNVDNLHERAGSRRLLHMHGELDRIRCRFCHAVHRHEGDLSVDTPCPACGREGGLRPHIVWFGEMPLHMTRIEQALSGCRTFVAIGTSGQVYPAAGFVALARRAGAHTAELNLEPSAVRDQFHQHLNGPATETVPAWVEQWLATPPQ